MLKVTSSGSFAKTFAFMDRILKQEVYSDLERFGQMGVDALANATPVETHLTASSWRYRIIRGRRPGIEWYNTHEADGTPVVILLQYGHATGTGGYVAGRDFINPAIRPIFDRISTDVWKKVTQ